MGCAIKYVATVCSLALALAVTGCVGNGSLQKKAYVDSDKGGKGFIGYEFPLNK
jgi:hypothetical protein